MRPNRAGFALRGLLAAHFLLCACCGCDLDWEDRAQRLFLKGVQKDNLGDWQSAKRFYQDALVANPYHPLANRNLAWILDTQEFNNFLAVIYYDRYLDLVPANSQDRELQKFRQRSQALHEICDGKLEDPADAIRDLLWAVRDNAPEFFQDRLHPNLLVSLSDQSRTWQQYLREWHDNLRGKEYEIVYREIDRFRSPPGAALRLVLTDSGRRQKTTLDIYFNLGKEGLWYLAGIEQPEPPPEPTPQAPAEDEELFFEN